MVSKTSFKDRSLLLLTGLVTAMAAWAFWSYLGENAFAAFMLITTVTLWFDNRNLRRRLRDKPPSGLDQR